MKPPDGNLTRLSWICGRTPIPTFPSTNRPRPSMPSSENKLGRLNGVGRSIARIDGEKTMQGQGAASTKAMEGGSRIFPDRYYPIKRRGGEGKETSWSAPQK